MNSENSDLTLQLAYRHMQSGQSVLAEALIKQVIARNTGQTGEASAALAELYTQQRNSAAAIEALDAARKPVPANSEILTRFANVYRNWGKFGRAKECYREALALDPERAPRIHLALATTCRFEEHDDDLRAIEAAYAESANDPVARRYLGFALGKAFDDLRDYDRAFPYFLDANEIVANEMPAPAFPALAREYEQIQHSIGTDFVKAFAGEGIQDRTPVFVTGLPRSGTTLVEQILASHPDVHGGGETALLTRNLMAVGRSLGSGFPQAFMSVEPEVFRDVARNFVAKISTAVPRTTNKNLFNYLWVGWIRAFLPNAKIIICKRDPRDIGISSFQLDLGRAYAWSYRLDWIGHQYRVFDELTAHWIDCFGDQVHVIQYEDLVTSTEPNIRQLLEYCELAFDPACLESHQTDRVVTTSSRAQVRNPISNASVGRWKNYEKHLGALIGALGECPA